MTDEEHVWGLVMPFVVTKSNGGPYDDESFVAGARMARMRERCLRGESPIESYEPTPLVPQLNLIAMDCGYRMTNEPWNEHAEEWSLVTLTKVEDDSP